MASVRALYLRFRDLLHEAARFSVVGLTGLAVTDSGANLLQYEAGMDRFSATAIAMIAGTALAFVASRYWTFRHRERTGAGRETVLFFAVNGIGVAISEGCVALASAFGLTGKLAYNVALNGGTALVALFRYWSYRRWVWPSAATASGRVSRPGLRRSARERLSRFPVRELAKFGLVGAFTCPIAGAVTFLLHARLGVGPLSSALVALVVVGAASYPGNRCWTFRHRQRIGIRRESVRYVALYGAGLVVRLSCVALTAYGLGLHGSFYLEVALAAGAALAAVFQFWSYREWVWPTRRAVPATARP